ncbi:MAG: hypothetical protein Q7T19_12460 [Caulobacter sp.]|nr:hypothetical protein [Caulobacter sp.]
MRKYRNPLVALRFQRPTGWLGALRTYLLVSLLSHLAWETIQLPLYTIWSTASPGELAFAVLHCAGGDMLIALATLVASLLVTGGSDWPFMGHRRVAVLTVSAGLAYTIFSEWLNTGVRGAWTYSDLMPTLPLIGTGLSPLLQWALIPTAALVMVGRPSSTTPRQTDRPAPEG